MTDGPGQDTPPAAAGEGGGAPAPKRERRRKKADLGRVSALFDHFAYQYGSDIAWDTLARMPIKISHLRHTFGNDAVRVWMNSERRRVVTPEQVVFDPAESCGPECVNLFRGLGVEPAKGDCQPVLDLLDHLCDRDETVSAWILDWIAWQVQHPGDKLPTAVIMHGDEGSGKNLFWERAVMPLFGEHGAIVGQAELESKYNAWISKRMFIVGDEVLSRHEMRNLKGKLKSMISGRLIQIEDKFLPLRMEANHVNMVFLSNELQPNALDASDRRYLVVWTPRKREQDWYKSIGGWLADGGRERFMHLLLKRDLSAFDPHAAPPPTKAKADLIDLGRPNPERFWLAWKAGELRAPFNTCSADQAYRLYRRWCGAEGERYPMTKPVFARMVLRIAQDALSVRVAKLSVTQTTRLWLSTPPPVDEDFGAFAQGAIDAFEAHLRGFEDATG